MNAINISNITNDRGDIFDDERLYDFDTYDYVEESTEPEPPKICSHGKLGKMGDPAKLNTRFRVSQFNLLYKANTKP